MADLANNYKGFLSPDKDCFYDELIEIDLSKVIVKKNNNNVNILLCYLDLCVDIWMCTFYLS